MVNLLHTYACVASHIQSILKEHGLSMPQYNILRILRGQKGKPAALLTIKERMLDKQSDVSRIVDRLLSKGLIERHTCPADRRKVDVLINEKGLALLSAIDACEGRMSAITGALSGEELRQLNDLLDKLRSVHTP